VSRSAALDHGPSIREVVQREYAIRKARRAVEAADEAGDPAGSLLARRWLVQALVLAAEDRRVLADGLVAWARTEGVSEDALDRLAGALEAAR
jgi:hypothetical protein